MGAAISGVRACKRLGDGRLRDVSQWGSCQLQGRTGFPVEGMVKISPEQATPQEGGFRLSSTMHAQEIDLARTLLSQVAAVVESE